MVKPKLARGASNALQASLALTGLNSFMLIALKREQNKT